MTGNSSFYPNQPIARFYLNNAQGFATTPIDLGAPRCNVTLVSNDAGPQNSSANIIIRIGYADQPVTSTSNQFSPMVENFWGRSISETQTYINQLKGCMVKVACMAAAVPSQTPIGNQVQVINNLPQTSVVTVPPIDQIIFVGYVYNITQVTGNYCQELHLSCIDFGGLMEKWHFNAFPVRNYNIDNPSQTLYNLLHIDCLPDFNTMTNGCVIGNMDGNDQQEIDVTLLYYDIKLNMPAFYGFDFSLENVIQTRKAWSDADIMDTIFDYINSYEAKMLSNTGINIGFVDQTSGLSNSYKTYSARQSLWQIANEVCGRKRGMLLKWSYGGTLDATQINLNCFLQSKTNLGNFSAAPIFNFIQDNTPAVDFYAEPPVLNYEANDMCTAVRISTKPVNFIYTFNLENQFYPGWPSYQTAPDDDLIKNGGVYSGWYSRFVMNPYNLYKVYGGGIVPDDQLQPESWIIDETAIGVSLSTTALAYADGGIEGYDGSVSLTYISTLEVDALVGFNETYKIKETIPLTSLIPVSGQEGTNSPILLFESIGENDAQPTQDVQPRFVTCDMTINPPLDDIERYADPIERENIWCTLMIEETPPLYVVVTKNDTVYPSDASILEIEYPYTPTVILNNTVVAIDEDQIPKIVEPSVTGIGTLRDPNGLTLQNLYDDMLRYGLFYARNKIKIEWTITYIDPVDHVGNFLNQIDVPAIWVKGGSPGAIIGVGDATFNRLTANVVITKTTWDFQNQKTTIISDYANFHTRNE